MQFQIGEVGILIGSRMGRVRLTEAPAGQLPASVQRPSYARAALKPGILHLGDGAFHRCHQAEWTDDALALEFGDWGIVGVILRPPDLSNVLGVQSGVFCRELREGGAVTRRLVGSEGGPIQVL